MNRCSYRCWCYSSQNGSFRSRYGFSREALLSIFRALLEARELSLSIRTQNSLRNAREVLAGRMQVTTESRRTTVFSLSGL
jgi:hypothetical protein